MGGQVAPEGPAGDLPRFQVWVQANKGKAQRFVAPGRMVLVVGDSLEVSAPPHTIRLEAFLVTQAIRDADSARFAYTAELAEEVRRLTAENTLLRGDQERLWELMNSLGYEHSDEELEEVLKDVPDYREGEEPD